jgi:hypothetical protein
MSSSLDEWQARLGQHFAALHRERGTKALFALEHGLDSSETDALAQAVRIHAASTSPSRLHALAWVLVDAECEEASNGK